ncbi:UNVERIFIED_CONTAM: hypothetical protein K2H54_041227 [Gekko kuhli]
MRGTFAGSDSLQVLTPPARLQTLHKRTPEEEARGRRGGGVGPTMGLAGVVRPWCPSSSPRPKGCAAAAATSKSSSSRMPNPTVPLQQAPEELAHHLQRERLKRSQKSMKAEGSDSATSHSLPSEETATMTEVKVKTEVPDEYVQEVAWQDDAKDSKKSLKDEAGEVPAEICVVIGGVRNQQTLGALGHSIPANCLPYVSGLWLCSEQTLPFL